MIFSSKLRNCKVTPNKTKCLVEVTPEHHAQHRQNQSQHSSPAISIGSQRLTNLRPNSNVSQRQIISQDHSENHQNDQDLIQRVSDVMKIEQCDKLVKGSGDNGLNTTSSTSSNHSQKSSESSNSFYASIPNMSTVNNQSKSFDPVISLMLSNNQPPLQLQNGIPFGDRNDKISDQQYRKELLARKELQMHPTYANFIAKNQVTKILPILLFFCVFFLLQKNAPLNFAL